MVSIEGLTVGYKHHNSLGQHCFLCYLCGGGGGGGGGVSTQEAEADGNGSGPQCLGHRSLISRGAL